MLSTFLLSLVIITTTCNALIAQTCPAETGILNGPSYETLNLEAAKKWHEEELGPKLMCGLFAGNDPQKLTFETKYFPNKASDFVFKNEDGNGAVDTSTLIQFKAVVDGVQNTVSFLQSKLGNNFAGLELSSCTFVEAGYQRDDDGYKIQSDQIVKFIKFEVSVTRVTYSFDTNDVLLSIQMKSMVNDESNTFTVAGAITSLKGERRRLMERESVQMLMNMPKTVSVPLIIAIVCLWMFIGVILFSRTIRYCRSLVFSRKQEKIHDVELTKI